MEDKLNKQEGLKETPLITNSASYRSNEMVSCKKCNRKNPPTRLDCMYCGVELEFDESQNKMLKPVLRSTESHLNGFNLIYLGNLGSWNDKQVSEVSKMTRLPTDKIIELFKSKKKLPIARAETQKETKIVAKRLEELGILTRVFEDNSFKMNIVSKRLRTIEFDDDVLKLLLFNNDETITIKKENISLLVIGGIFEKQVESTEKYNKKDDNKVLDRAEVSSDEVLIDIYSDDDLISYRIFPKGFDFSLLGKEKELIATKNINILIEKLKNYATNTTFDDDYLKLRSNLSQIWEVEEKTDSKGIERKSFGSFNKHSIIKTSNLTQFTKYSRLQWLLRSN